MAVTNLCDTKKKAITPEGVDALKRSNEDVTMKIWTVDQLVAMAGRHTYSEPEFRMQILEVTATSGTLWTLSKGAMIAIALKGECILAFPEGEALFMPPQQVVFNAGDAFAFWAREAGRPAVLQC